MTRQHYQGRLTPRVSGPAPGFALAISLAGALVLAACGSGSGRAASAAPASSATCTLIGAALSDGPDPAADPVGYAEAQIKPLLAIRTGDTSLRAAISHLASAYAAVYNTDGKSAAAAKAVKAASKKVNTFCPGVA